MSTKRTPIGRPPAKQITAKAIEIFRTIADLDCTCALSVEGGGCPGCLEYARLNTALRAELKLVEWQWPTFITPYDETESVYLPGTMGAAWFPRARSLYTALCKAARVQP
jgi:hypothetical protein